MARSTSSNSSATLKSTSGKSAPAKSAVKSTASKKAAPAKVVKAAKAPTKKSAAPAAKKPAASPPIAKKAAPARKVTTPVNKAPATKATPASAKKTAPAKKAAPAARKATAPAKKAAAPAAKKAAPAAAKKAAPAKKAAAPAAKKAPAKKKSPYGARFLAAQEKLLLEERATYSRQMNNLRDEAAALVEGFESGDVQFDEESGEGDTINIERERDLALSESARQIIEEIDHAIAKLTDGTYGICEVSGDAIPPERLEAIPWARERVEYKIGGISRR